jgi:hypothetical protein
MDKSGRALRITAIVLMSLTAAMNILGGAGTSCVAFSSNIGYRMAFKELMDIRWLYQGLVVITILIGLAGVWAAVRLVRGGPAVYRWAVSCLVGGTIIGGVHYIASQTLRGAAAPANVKFYLNAFTLLFFILIGMPGIREKVDFTKAGSGKAEKASAAGVAAILAGVTVLTVFTWAAPSHTMHGENWVYVFYKPLLLCGILFLTTGFALLTHAAIHFAHPEIKPAELEYAQNQ